MTPTVTPPLDRPKGIFVLDSFAGTYRDGNMRNYAFVDGYVWRYGWHNLESGVTPGSYNFAALDHIMARAVSMSVKLSMIIVPGEPLYLTNTPTVQTWMHGSVSKPLPWDADTIARFGAFLQALAAHAMPDPAQGGAPVALKDHSNFYMLNVCIPGMPNGGIRDKDVSMVDIPGYTRSRLIDDAIIQNLLNARAAFPDKFLSVGFWSAIEDDGGSPTLWTAIRDRILLDFDGVARKRLTIFMDNLAASRPCLGCSPYSGAPDTGYAQALDSMQDACPTAIQALTSWKNPSTQPISPTQTQADKVLNGTPMDGIEFGLNTYQIRYFELYVEDVDEVAWQSDLTDWATTLDAYP